VYSFWPRALLGFCWSDNERATRLSNPFAAGQAVFMSFVSD
jgi:hypothetical protein